MGCEMEIMLYIKTLLLHIPSELDLFFKKRFPLFERKQEESF